MIHSADITFQMLEDWRNVDLNSITKQTLYTMEDSKEDQRRLIIHCKRVCVSAYVIPITVTRPKSLILKTSGRFILLVENNHTQSTKGCDPVFPPAWLVLTGLGGGVGGDGQSSEPRKGSMTDAVQEDIPCIRSALGASGICSVTLYTAIAEQGFKPESHSNGLCNERQLSI